MVTIKDVARAAGVSVATVSRAHNRSHLVTEATGRRVRAVAERLGYSPHAAARSLSTRQTSTIGVLLPDLYGEFYSELIRGIDQTAQRHGFHLLLASSHNEKGAITAALQSMRGRVDGLVVMSPALGAHLAVRDLPASFPVVLLNSAAAGSRVRGQRRHGDRGAQRAARGERGGAGGGSGDRFRRHPDGAVHAPAAVDRSSGHRRAGVTGGGAAAGGGGQPPPASQAAGAAPRHAGHSGILRRARGSRTAVFHHSGG